jgi:hypothetical protein
MRSHCHLDRRPKAAVERSGCERAVSGVCVKVCRPARNPCGREARLEMELRQIRDQMSRLRCASLDMTRGGGCSVRHDRLRKNLSESVSEHARVSVGMAPGLRVEGVPPSKRGQDARDTIAVPQRRCALGFDDATRCLKAYLGGCGFYRGFTRAGPAGGVGFRWRCLHSKIVWRMLERVRLWAVRYAFV